MNTRPLLTHLTALAVAAGLGWFVRDAVSDGPIPVPPLPPTATAASSPPAAAPAGQPLIAVSSDGAVVTLRVEQQPLDWVLEQIALQTGSGERRPRAQPTGAPASVSTDVRLAASTPEIRCAEAPPVTAADERRLFAAIERGSEAERFEGLLTAVSGGVTVPEPLLKTMLETDASERVRLVALERYLEPRSGDPAALRTALEAALYVPHAAVQREARRRLDELTESQRPDPSDPQQVPP